MSETVMDNHSSSLCWTIFFLQSKGVVVPYDFTTRTNFYLLIGQKSKIILWVRLLCVHSKID